MFYFICLFSSRSTSRHRSRRSPPSASGGSRRPPPSNEIHRENPIPSACLGVFGLSQYTTERDLKGMSHSFPTIWRMMIVFFFIRFISQIWTN